MKANKQTVLIVDDDAEVIPMAVELFKSLGYKALTATNGVDAIEILSKPATKIDVLFSDVVMPNGVSGIALANTVSKFLPNIKVILCSGYPMPALKEEHYDIGEFIFLNKPYRLDDLTRSLQ